jgi:hypothetical protein
MHENRTELTPRDRTALLQHGIVVLDSFSRGGRRQLDVTGSGEDRVRGIVGRLLGEDVIVDVVDVLPRRLRPLRCVGHMEREPGRLQLRFVIAGDDHVDDITVAEDDATVVVFGTVCTTARLQHGERCEVPCHVYLDGPLGDRAVIDGTTGEDVPFKDVYAEIAARERL